jgi:hypothetical protein
MIPIQKILLTLHLLEKDSGNKEEEEDFHLTTDQEIQMIRLAQKTTEKENDP